MTNRLTSTVLLLLLAFCLLSFRIFSKEEAGKPQRVKANNAVALRDLVGKKATVYGKIESTGKSSSGHQFLNFYGKQVSIFCPKTDLPKFKDGAPADLFNNKDIEVTGTLTRYKNKLQIKLTDPAQIKRLDPNSPSSNVKPIKLKEIGKNVWLSPAGLRYQGRDPEGLTRVEHIMRHVRDIPDRDGPHGVFDGGKGVAFAVIDEAWQLAQKKKLRASVEGDRSSYLVFMKRRVGYLGGRTGKQKRNPPLDRVFIVFETDTKNIVTAFPR
jgi:hypothetical protein